MNRCIAIAAHGRRCQQTSHGASDFCWHHGHAERRADRAVTGRPPETRLATLLGPEGTARLVAFLESGKPGRVRLPAGPERTGVEVRRDPGPGRSSRLPQEG